MGLPVLENAMAGALVVAHEGFVKPELLRSLAHYEYRDVEQIDWDSLVDRLQPAKFRRRASHFNWARVAERMLDAFTGRDQAIPSEPMRHGQLLVVPPPVVTDARFSSLATWRAQNVRVEHAQGADRLVPISAKPLHYVRRDVPKNPWPETFTFTFTVRPNGRDEVAAWLCGELDDERAEVRFDLERLEASPGRTTHGWVLLDATAVRVGQEVLCQVVAQSDHAPVLRCYVLVARRGKVEFQAEADEPGIAIRRLQLGKGVGLIADVSEGQAVAVEEMRAAAVG
jgi:hypothetical protein